MKTKIYLISVILITAFVSLAAAGASSSLCAGNCHIIKPYEENAGNEDLLVYKHVQAGLTCTDCHERSAETIKEEQDIYKAGDYTEPMYMREYPKDFCLKCHSSYQEVAERTKDLKEQWGRNPHESHLDEPDCYTCHRMHRTQEFVCSECHKGDWQNRLPAGWIAK